MPAAPGGVRLTVVRFGQIIAKAPTASNSSKQAGSLFLARAGRFLDPTYPGSILATTVRFAL